MFLAPPARPSPLAPIALSFTLMLGLAFPVGAGGLVDPFQPFGWSPYGLQPTVLRTVLIRSSLLAKQVAVGMCQCALSLPGRQFVTTRHICSNPLDPRRTLSLASCHCRQLRRSLTKGAPCPSGS
jgi:hypothetical protein